MEIELRRGKPFSEIVERKDGTFFLFTPTGFHVENPQKLTRREWQRHIDKFCRRDSSIPDGFEQSAHLLEFAGRGIKAVYGDIGRKPPGLMIYNGQYPGFAKNFFLANDRNIYMSARWFAARALLDPNKERPFYTEGDKKEVLFVGTPCARAAIVAMSEAQHALDFEEEKLTGMEGTTGINLRMETLADYDSQPPEYMVLCKILERMRGMPDIFPQVSQDSIEARITEALKRIT